MAKFMSMASVAGAALVLCSGVACGSFNSTRSLWFPSWLWYALSCIFTFVGLLSLGIRSVRFLDNDEQLRVQRLTATTVHNGPGLVFLTPFTYRSADVVKADMLSTLDYATVVDTASGLGRVEQGPKLLFLGSHEKVVTKGQGTSLSTNEYLIVENKLSGEKHVVEGPCVWFPGAHDTAQKGSSIILSMAEYLTVEDKLSGDRHVVKGPCVWVPKPHEVAKKDSSINLNTTEYIIVEDKLTGKLALVKGPHAWFPTGPYEMPSKKGTAITLKEDEYVRLKDVSSGNHWMEKGPGLVFLEPMWQVEGAGTGVKKAWVLKANEYLRFLDVNTGKVSVHRGESKVFPGPDDTVLDGGVQKCIEVDGEHAVLVRDKRSGQLRLVSEKQLFVPGPNDDVEEVRELIKLADHEAMIIKDADGNFQYYYGSDEKRSPDQPKAFFLPPHAETVKVWWSRGPRRERKDVSFERFDCRPHFMKFEFNCRTSDNVELILEGVLFWELVDLPLMWSRTGDTSGDMVYHIRSKFILHVAQVSLKCFMESLHEISKSILAEDVDFYKDRGIQVHSLEVTRYQCAEASTAEILSQIIQETTNRMNRLSQAESENEVNVFRTQGQVEQANVSSRLMEIQREQEQANAQVAGNAEADRVAGFLRGLEKEVPQLEDRIKLWQVLRKTEALSVVSKGSANLYFTPSDVDLSIEARNDCANQSSVNGQTISQ